MPNLYSHVILAEEILNKVSDKELKDLINQNLPLYYLGSISPDIFLYNFSGRAIFLRLSSLLHDHPEPKTLGIIGALLDEIKKNACLDRANLVFTLGFITHIVAENIFHPPIYYFTGDYYDPDPNEQELSVASHRHLEVMLDLFLIEETHKKLNDLKLNRIMGVSPDKRMDIFMFFAVALSGISGDSPSSIFAALNRSYSYLLFLNRLFSNKYFYYLFKLLDLLPINIINPFFQLFYPPRVKRLPPIFKSSFFYKNPVTGKEIRTSMGELKEETGRVGAGVLQGAYQYVSGKVNLSFLEKVKITSGKMSFFSPLRF